MSSLTNFLRKINDVTRGVNNITRTVAGVNATIRSVRTLRDQIRGKKTTRTTTKPTGAPSQPQVKPLGLTPVSQRTSGRNTNVKPVRPSTASTKVGPKIR
jgi:hypothetical protein